MRHSSVRRRDRPGETGYRGDGFRHQLDMRSGESSIVSCDSAVSGRSTPISTQWSPWRFSGRLIGSSRKRPFWRTLSTHPMISHGRRKLKKPHTEFTFLRTTYPTIIDSPFLGIRPIKAPTSQKSLIPVSFERSSMPGPPPCQCTSVEMATKVSPERLGFD